MFSKVRNFLRWNNVWTQKKDVDEDDLKIYGPRTLTRQENENDLKIYTPRDSSRFTKNNTNDAELKVARLMLYFSVSVLCCKIYFAHRKMFDTWIAKLFSALSTAWQLAVDLNWFLVPLLTGLMITHITWVVIYYDSQVPGVQPPSPFNTTKASGRRWHSCYIAAVANGIIFFIILLLLYR